MKITGAPKSYKDHCVSMSRWTPTKKIHHRRDVDVNKNNLSQTLWNWEARKVALAVSVELNREFLFWQPLTKSIWGLPRKMLMQDQGSIQESWACYPRIYGMMLWGIMRKKSQGKRHLLRNTRFNPNHAPALSSKKCYKLTPDRKVPGSNNLQLHLLRTIFHCANLSSYFYLGAKNILAQR